MTFVPGQTLTAADLNAALAGYTRIADLAATAHGQGGGLVGLSSGDTLETFVAKLLASTGAGVIGAADGRSIQAFINTILSPAGAAAIGYGASTVKVGLDSALQAAAANQGAISLLTTAVSAGGALPFEVTGLSGSFTGTGSGGTPGEYALIISGGPAGHTAFITIGSDGKIASARIGARGIATTNSAPTYSLPTGTGLTGGTLPTPTVSALAAGRVFFAPNANSGATLKLGWLSSGGVIAPWTIGGVQYSEYFSGAIDANFAPASAVTTKASAEVYEYLAAGMDLTNPPLYLDSDGRVLRRVTDPGVLASLTSLIALVGQGPVSLDTFEYITAGGPAQVPLVLDSTGLVILWSSDTAALSNNLTALTARVSKRSDANGMPLYSPVYAAHRLRRTAMKLRQLSSPFSVAGVQINMLFQGNSYIDTNAYFIQNTLKGLRAKYGSGGPGYASFGSSDILDPQLFRTQAGSWTVVDETVPTLDLYLRQSSTPGDTITLQSFSGGQPINYARLFWTGTSDGVIQYRFNGGSWTTLNVQGSGFQSLLLSGISTISGAWTIDFQVVSGTVKLHGVDLRNSNAGIIVHKAGNNGSTAYERETLDAAQQQAAIAAVAPDIGIIIDATNDKTLGRSPAQFAASYVAMIQNHRAAVPVSGGIPAIDMLLCVENNIVPHASNPSADYMAAILNVADQYDCAVLSMIDVFGQDPNTYSSWMDTYNSPPGYHPDGASGGYLWVDQLLKIFNA